MEENGPSDEFSDSMSEKDLQKLPAYAFVPGLTPRPQEPASTELDLRQQITRGRYLFDHGFYWEAHEMWESVWIALGRTGPQADFVKSLIKLAACGVKSLELNPRGACRHARRAAELLQQLSTADSLGGSSPPDLSPLLEFSMQLIENPVQVTDDHRRQALHGGVPILGRLPEVEFPIEQ